MRVIYGIKARKLGDGEIDLAEYRGKVLMLVNVASRCGFTPQYRELEALYEKYRERGFMILGFPCNDFFHQEPGTESEIRQFCESRYDVKFDLFEKIRVLGPEAHPLYRTLQEAGLPLEGGQTPKFIGGIKNLALKFKGMEPPPANGVQWNFQKYLISREGVPVAAFSPQTRPLDTRITSRIEEELDRAPSGATGPESS